KPRLLVEHSAGVACVAFSPDGQSFATGGHDRMVHLWDRRTGDTLQSWNHPGRILSVAYSPDSKLILAGGIPSATSGTLPRANPTLHQCPILRRSGPCVSARTAKSSQAAPGVPLSRWGKR